MTNRIEQLEALLTDDPNDTFCLYGLAQEHAKIGAHDKAVEYYDRTLGVDPGYCYAYFHKARSLEAQELIAEAKATLESGVAASLKAGDAKAHSEISGYLDSLSD